MFRGAVMGKLRAAGRIWPRCTDKWLSRRPARPLAAPHLEAEGCHAPPSPPPDFRRRGVTGGGPRSWDHLSRLTAPAGVGPGTVRAMGGPAGARGGGGGVA